MYGEKWDIQIGLKPLGDNGLGDLSILEWLPPTVLQEYQITIFGIHQY